MGDKNTLKIPLDLNSKIYFDIPENVKNGDIFWLYGILSNVNIKSRVVELNTKRKIQINIEKSKDMSAIFKKLSWGGRYLFPVKYEINSGLSHCFTWGRVIQFKDSNGSVFYIS